MTKYGRVRQVYVPEEADEKIERLAKLLRADGIDIENEKNPGTTSVSKMLRWLVDRELERRGQLDSKP